MTEFERLHGGLPTLEEPLGALALLGAWGDIDEKELDSLIEEIYENRLKDSCRQIDIERQCSVQDATP